MTNASFFSILTLLADHKQFDPPQGWYLINSATLGFTKLEILRDQFYRWCLF